MKKHFLTKPVFWRTNAFLTLYGLSGACLASGFSLSVEQGTGNLGNASAGSAAVAEDATTIFYNPAGLTRLSGTQYHAGGHFVAPSAKFSDGGSVTSLPTTPATPLFGTDGSDGALTGLVPNFYYATDLTESLRFGLGVSVPYGLSTEYSPLWRGRYHALESHLMTLNLNPTLAFKATEQLSVGFGINAQYAKAELSNAIDTGTACAGLEAATLITAGSCSTAGLAPLQSDGKQELEGDDWSFGFNFGLLYEFNDRSRIGLAYRSKVKHELEGDVEITTPAGVSGIPLLAGLLASGDINADVELPETLSLSLYHRMNNPWALLADVTYTRWDRFQELKVVRTSGTVLSNQPEEWNNTWRYSLALNYHAHPEWMFRAGFAYDETPIPSAELRTPRIPTNNRRWISVGFSHQASRTLRIDGGYAHLFLSDTPIQNEEISTKHDIIGSYNNTVDIFSLALNWSFD